jgi:hypothetical protein
VLLEDLEGALEGDLGLVVAAEQGQGPADAVEA